MKTKWALVPTYFYEKKSPAKSAANNAHALTSEVVREIPASFYGWFKTKISTPVINQIVDLFQIVFMGQGKINRVITVYVCQCHQHGNYQHGWRLSPSHACQNPATMAKLFHEDEKAPLESQNKIINGTILNFGRCGSLLYDSAKVVNP